LLSLPCIGLSHYSLNTTILNWCFSSTTTLSWVLFHPN
jgi:hypothetical protein